MDGWMDTIYIYMITIYPFNYTYLLTIRISCPSLSGASIWLCPSCTKSFRCQECQDTSPNSMEILSRKQIEECDTDDDYDDDYDDYDDDEEDYDDDDNDEDDDDA